MISKTAGTDAAGCAPAQRTAVHAGEDVHFCIVVANAGDMPLVTHTLADPMQELTATFAYTLAPSERLTITSDALAGLGIDGTLARRNVTATLINTVAYTGVTPPDFADTGAATASTVATATVDLVQARVALTQTVGTDPAVCGANTSLELPDANTQFYHCAVLRNTGNIAIAQHRIAQPRVNIVTSFTRTLEPGAILSVTNALLAEMGVPAVFGPYAIAGTGGQFLNNTMDYTGLASAILARTGETRRYTATTSAFAFAGIDATPTPTPTYTNTPRPVDSRPTNTPWPTATATWTPAFPTPTPGLADAQAPTNTPTPTRSYAISLLATPTSPFVSPLAGPEQQVDAAATQDALATIAALDATAAAIAVSPLDTPVPTPTETATIPPSDTPSPTPTAIASPEPAVVIVVTNTPDAAPTQRPIVSPTPTATPDYLLAAARTVDAIAMTGVWIWFMLGSLVFFIVAGVFAGLSFRHNDRQRFDLLNDGLWIDEDFLLPPPRRPPTKNSTTGLIRCHEFTHPHIAVAADPGCVRMACPRSVKSESLARRGGRRLLRHPPSTGNAVNVRASRAERPVVLRGAASLVFARRHRRIRAALCLGAGRHGERRPTVAGGPPDRSAQAQRPPAGR